MSLEFVNRICPNCKNPNYMVSLGDFSKAYKYKCMNCNGYFNDIDFEKEPLQPAEEPKFKKLKVPEKCAECRNCMVAITGSFYCHAEAISPNNSQMDISTIYVDLISRPVWCPIVKANEELDRMPINKRADLDKLITGLSFLWGGEELWE